MVASPVLQRSAIRSTIEAVRRCITDGLENVAPQKDDINCIVRLPYLCPKKSFGKCELTMTKGKKKTLVEESHHVKNAHDKIESVSDDTMWPMDDIDEDEEALSTVSQSVPALTSKTGRDSTREDLLTVQLLLQAMKEYRTFTKKAKSTTDLKKADVQNELQKLARGRHQFALDRIDEVVINILCRASSDATLPQELRLVLPWLNLYSYTVEVTECSNEWSVRINLDDRDALRHKKLTLLCSELSSEQIESAYSKYQDAFTDIRNNALLEVVYIQRTRTSEKLDKKQRLGEDLVAVTTPGLKRECKFTIHNERVMTVYLMLHSLARWKDSQTLLEKSDRDYLAILTLLLHRYPEQNTEN
ncbi:hypothetical protein CYMTET_41254 [Cymbomonas tetramitiformis]|uniref:Uncharacterized protein n=1 Tax=Cymbomonas tetramitiformis TaxID=36881 RepID=A0AAE0F2P6_9CHLO|nr:hypothetical protein CYMTET_41254 [Cymbomonas tetramitiformis]